MTAIDLRPGSSRRPIRVGLFGLALAMMFQAGCASPDSSSDSPSGKAASATGPIYGFSREVHNFKDLRKMVDESTVVVLATVQSTRPGRVVGQQDEPFQFREVTLSIDEVLAGSVSDDEIALEEFGWELDRPMIIDNVQPSEPGDRGYYFLTPKEDVPYYMLISSQGRYLIEGDQLEGSNPDDDLVKQLQKLAPPELKEKIKDGK